MRSTSPSCWPAADPAADPIAEGGRCSRPFQRWFTWTPFADKLFVFNCCDPLTCEASQ